MQYMHTCVCIAVTTNTNTIWGDGEENQMNIYVHSHAKLLDMLFFGYLAFFEYAKEN